MDQDLLLKAAIALGPVVVLLFVFDRLDVFNLIPMRTILLLLGVGGVVAGLTFVANVRVLDGFPMGFSNFSKYVAPVLEESLKAIPVVALFGLNRIGFKLDAAISGFAIGAGFSMVENLWYLQQLGEANVSAWLVRGFGTAVMHGSATAMFAIISHEMTENQAEDAAARYRFNPFLFMPGLLAAILIHGVFNQFPNQPVLVMGATLLLAPAMIFLTLTRSERATQKWLKADEATHRQALADIRAGTFAETDAGLAIRQMANRVRAGAYADALAYVELKTELVLRAEELIHASQAGESAQPGEAERTKFADLAALEKKLGRSLLAAMATRLNFSRNDLWELERLRVRCGG
ncbi:PrsW family glutamic-type intramembrane protease [Terricaulis sp.]|uniref:PrsW family glutamic-type intramembrane protease n=1 Tax=Terricaulis sp. TaxID=2768686 RepID=UPI003784D59F